MNILLHICCAPCSIYPIDELRRLGHKVGGYFYNPNIHMYSEFLKRRAEVEKYSKSVGLNVIYPDYDVEKYFEHIIYNEVSDSRCPMCWWIRMANAARFAKENGFDAFTSTLLGSPFQDHDVIRKICSETAKNTEIEFFYNDFRVGYNKGQEKAKRLSLYRQNYCGCLFSEKERIDAKNGKRKEKK